MNAHKIQNRLARWQKKKKTKQNRLVLMRWAVQSCILRARFLLLSWPQILKCKNQKVWTLTQVQTLQNHKHIIYYSYLGLKSEYLDNWCANFIRRILDALLSFIFNEKYYASREWGLYKAITKKQITHQTVQVISQWWWTWACCTQPFQ